MFYRGTTGLWMALLFGVILAAPGPSWAQTCSSGDTDSDGICNDVDNCTNHPNPSQLDADADGYGNRCDPDLDQDELVQVSDFSAFLGCLGAEMAFERPNGTFYDPRCAESDFDGDGIVGSLDADIFFDFFVSSPPGPSGSPCLDIVFETSGASPTGSCMAYNFFRHSICDGTRCSNRYVVPEVASPAFPGPLVLFGEKLSNSWKIASIYDPLRRLLEADGYRVQSSTADFDSTAFTDLRDEASIVVIAGSGMTEQLSQSETDSLRDWVELSGGSLLLVVDHKDAGFEALLQTFGVSLPVLGDTVVFTKPVPTPYLDQFVAPPAADNQGTIGSHPIASGRDATEQLYTVSTHGGTAIEWASPPPGGVSYTSVLTLGEDAASYSGDVDVTGLSQGLAVEFGAGRIYVAGEAIMLTAIWRNDLFSSQAQGFESTNGPSNAQHALNVARWLSGVLP